MSWVKSDYKGRVCWEQDGSRVFDTAEIDKFEHTCNNNSDNLSILVVVFFVGVIVGLLLVQAI